MKTKNDHLNLSQYVPNNDIQPHHIQRILSDFRGEPCLLPHDVSTNSGRTLGSGGCELDLEIHLSTRIGSSLGFCGLSRLRKNVEHVGFE